MDDLLLVLGVVLFLLGLLTGFAVPKLANPRMGLASHVEAAMNGMFLIVLGLLWPRLELPELWLSVAGWLAIYAAFANWLATFLAALWGAGGSMMMIAAPDRLGTNGREAVIKFLLLSLSVAMVIAVATILVGLIRA
jgi:hydroxylaminobenzene mutase